MLSSYSRGTFTQQVTLNAQNRPLQTTSKFGSGSNVPSNPPPEQPTLPVTVARPFFLPSTYVFNWLAPILQTWMSDYYSADYESYFTCWVTFRPLSDPGAIRVLSVAVRRSEAPLSCMQQRPNVGMIIRMVQKRRLGGTASLECCGMSKVLGNRLVLLRKGLGIRLRMSMGWRHHRTGGPRLKNTGSFVSQ